jgi:hypothetical protein
LKVKGFDFIELFLVDLFSFCGTTGGDVEPKSIAQSGVRCVAGRPFQVGGVLDAIV